MAFSKICIICLICFRNDQLLIAAGARKKVFKWLNVMAFSNSYSTALRRNNALAVNHDYDVVTWKNNREELIKKYLQENPLLKYPKLSEKLKEMNLVEYDVIKHSNFALFRSTLPLQFNILTLILTN